LEGFFALTPLVAPGDSDDDAAPPISFLSNPSVNRLVDCLLPGLVRLLCLLFTAGHQEVDLFGLAAVPVLTCSKENELLCAVCGV
jgi:hypothetical protein